MYLAAFTEATAEESFRSNFQILLRFWAHGDSPKHWDGNARGSVQPLQQISLLLPPPGGTGGIEEFDFPQEKLPEHSAADGRALPPLHSAPALPPEPSPPPQNQKPLWGWGEHSVFLQVLLNEGWTRWQTPAGFHWHFCLSSLIDLSLNRFWDMGSLKPNQKQAAQSNQIFC